MAPRTGLACRPCPLLLLCLAGRGLLYRVLKGSGLGGLDQGEKQHLWYAAYIVEKPFFRWNDGGGFSRRLANTWEPNINCRCIWKWDCSNRLAAADITGG